MKLFTRHPNSVGETYVEHMGQAAFFSIRLIAAGLACAVHAVLPFLFKTTGKDAISDLHHRMVTHRMRRARTAGDAERTRV
jgi:hypothetical protein